MELYIGLMSGTSADGVDGVLARWDDERSPDVLAHVHQPFDARLRDELLALNQPAPDELHGSALAALAVARAYAAVVDQLLHSAGRPAAEVRAIGAHGQTVRHRPGTGGLPGYTLQLLNGALLAELGGIDVVCDLRSRDVAAGGQGAPLVPALHHALFADPALDVAVLNLGGIANLSLLPARDRAGAEAVTGFDCGPGNALMDAWCERHTGQRYDDEGRWAASGRVDSRLLRRLLDEPFIAAAPPKSTGRDLFDTPWLARQLAEHGHALPPPDVQATLAEFTARAVVQALLSQAPHTRRLLVCGGGARNRHLMRRLAAQLPGIDIADTARAGVPVDQVEALAFAWLARAFVHGEAGNLPSVTGARGPRRLGALHPAR
jgi:anhydro-N-acetylmuramic acid kinase